MLLKCHGVIDVLYHCRHAVTRLASNIIATIVDHLAGPVISTMHCFELRLGERGTHKCHCFGGLFPNILILVIVQVLSV